MDAPQATPGMRFPPPVAFIGGLALGFLLQHLVPVAIVPGSRLPRLLGGLPVLASGGLALWALRTFHRAGTTLRPDRPALSLVIQGPFQFTRNPMYLSLSLLHAGLALLANALWPALMLLPVLLIIQFHVIAREERHLSARFGADYQAYCRAVRRWF